MAPEREEWESLYKKGLDALYEGKPRIALRIAKQLQRLGSSAAYDIRANALRQMGKGRQAIEALRDGAGRYPTVARLWFLLGSFLSDQGQYEEALRCFDRASSGHGA